MKEANHEGLKLYSICKHLPEYVNPRVGDGAWVEEEVGKSGKEEHCFWEIKMLLLHFYYYISIFIL